MTKQNGTKTPLTAKIHREAHRHNKREQILLTFMAAPGVRMSSAELHARYGSIFVSELNRDPRTPIVIKDETAFVEGDEISVYLAEFKVPRTLPQPSLFGDDDE